METPMPKKHRKLLLVARVVLLALLTVVFAVIWAEEGSYFSTEKPGGTTSTKASPTPSLKEKMTISDSTTTTGADGTLVVTGKIKNNQETKRGAIVQATFYDQAGGVLGVAKGTVSEISPGETRAFTFPASASLASYYRMVVEVNSIQ